MKPRNTHYLRSETQDSVGVCSRTQSYDSSILIKDLDSRCFSIIDHKPNLSMTRELNYGVLTQSTEEELVEKVNRLEQEKRSLKESLFELEDKLRDQREHFESKIKLKDITEAEYVSGMNSMYQRNTTLSQQLIIYEKELKTALYKVCQLERELEQTNSKSKMRINRQVQLESKVKEIEQKILVVQNNYEVERMENINSSREWKFQIENMREELEKQKALKKQLETVCESMNSTIIDKQNKLARMNIIEMQNSRLISQIASLRQQISELKKQKVEFKQREEKSNRYHPDNFASSTIAALAIQNISLKQEQVESAKTLYMLQDKVKSYQTELYSRSINKQNSSIQRPEYHHQRYRKERFSSVARPNNSSFVLNQSEQLNEYGSSNSLQLKPKYRQSHFIDRRKRENANDMLIKKCKDLNQSLYI